MQPYLWLLLSADAPAPDGSLREVLDQSRRYAGDLADRLRERICEQVVPALAHGISDARRADGAGRDNLVQTYEMALIVRFRLLFIAYAEDRDLLPYRSAVAGGHPGGTRVLGTALPRPAVAAAACSGGGEGATPPGTEFKTAYLHDRSTLPCLAPRVAFRDVSRATDSRTVRVALVPPEVFIGNQAPYLLWPRGDQKDQAFIIGVLSSIPLDWYARRFVETHVNYFVFNPFPIPRPPRGDDRWRRVVALAGRLACPDERFRSWAAAGGVECGPLEAGEKNDMIHELDAVVAHLYGLTEAQLVHVFETFHEGWDCRDRLGAVLGHFRSRSRRG